MEKISGIVPASSRVQGVNLKDSQPLRPGVPSFGRPVGVSTLAEAKLTTAEKAVAVHSELMARRSGDAHKPQIITDMADQFFMKNAKHAGKPVQDLDMSFNFAPGRPDYIAPNREELMVPELDDGLQLGGSPEERALLAEADAEEYEFTPPGTYLNVQA